MKRTSLIMYLLGILYAQTFAQNRLAKVESKEIRALNIGDKVPDISFNLINNAKTSVQLSDLKGKLVILDFYGLYCSVCLEWMPKTDSLQKVFKDEVQFIAVNHEDAPKRITMSFDRLSNNPNSYWGMKKYNWNNSNLLFAINDKSANKLFPHLTVPHYVWIGPEGVVSAITGLKEISQENISKVLKNEPVDFKVKVDIGDGETNITLLREGLNYTNLDLFKFYKKGEIDNVGTGMQKYGLGKGIVTGVAIRNYPLLKLYTYLASELYQQSFGNPKFIKVEVKDPSRLIYTNSTESKRHWEKENSYTYDMIVPLNERDSVFRYALNDINKYSEFNGGLGKRKVKCYVLRRTSNIKSLNLEINRKQVVVYKDTQSIYDQPLSHIIDKFNASGPTIIKYPVLDETGYKGNVDLELPADYSDFTALNNALKKSGLELIEVDREIEMFIISDKK